MLLSKVQRFVRVQVLPKGVSELLVRDFAILVQVKLVEDVFELLVGQSVAPAFQQVLEIILVNVSSFFLTDISEGLLEGGPLEVKLVLNILEQLVQVCCLIYL
jgi:hypothetical protein